MPTKEGYLQGLLAELQRKKDKGKPGVFRIRAKIDHNIARYIEDYFKGKEEYLVEVRKSCGSCANFWDITVLFRKF